MAGLLVIATADAVGPEEVVIVVVEEHVTAFARSSASGVILDVVRSGAGCFCCC
jgi:ATP-dependent Clp protease adapter protein ClpS